MPDCPVHYKDLACGLTGVGYTAEVISGAVTTVRLRKGHGKQFPEMASGDYFYAYLTDGCNECCEQVKVTGIKGDVVTFERSAMSCDCYSTNSRLRYSNCSVEAIRAIASEVGINVVPPLRYDCATRTLSIDCGALHDMIANPCGDTDETDNVSGSGTKGQD